MLLTIFFLEINDEPFVITEIPRDRRLNQKRQMKIQWETVIEGNETYLYQKSLASQVH